MRIDIKDAHYGNNVISKIYYGNNLVFDKFADKSYNVYVFDLSKVFGNHTLTLLNVNSGTYTDWGDGSINTLLTHTYSNQSVYTVKTRQRIDCGGDTNTINSIINCINIDDSIIDYSAMFLGCTNLTTVPAIPNSIKDCSYMLSYTNITTAPIIPSSIISCTQMFESCPNLTTIPQANIDLMQSVKNGTNTTCINYRSCYEDCTNITNPQTYATLSGLYPNWFTS